MKPAKEGIITDILELLGENKGFAEAKSVIVPRYQFTERTFVRYWKKASVMYSEAVQARRKKLEATQTAVEKKALTDSLRTKNEHLAQLERMLDPDYRTVEVLMTRDGVEEYERPLKPSEITAIKALIGSWQGYPAPTKVSATDSEGKTLKINVGSIFLSSE